MQAVKQALGKLKWSFRIGWNTIKHKLGLSGQLPTWFQILISFLTGGFYFYHWINQLNIAIKETTGKVREAPKYEFVMMIFLPFYMPYVLYKREKQFVEHLKQKGIEKKDRSVLYLITSIFFVSFVAAVYMQRDLEDQNYAPAREIPDGIKAILFLSPAMIFLGAFTFYPIFNSFILAFLEGYDVVSGEIDGFTFVGNFKHILGLAGFWEAVLNTSILVFVSVPISVVISLLIAVALNGIQKVRTVFQTIFFLPYVTNSIALGLVFAFMFKGDAYGLVNNVLGWFGIEPVRWLGVGAGYWAAMSVLLAYTIWNALAFKIIVFLSGIQGIDKQYYQAAQVDATPRARVFRRITVPLLSPMIMYITITSFIGAFKAYTSVIALFGEGARPSGASYTMKTIVFYVYDFLAMAGSDGALSYAAAASLILFAIILVFTIIQLQISKRRVHY